LTERLFFDGVRAMKLLTEIKHGSFFGNGEARRSCAAKRLNDLNGCLFPKGFAAGPNIRNKRKLNTDFERLQDAILIFSKGVTCGNVFSMVNWWEARRTQLFVRPHL
jgi:hypothetical protein